MSEAEKIPASAGCQCGDRCHPGQPETASPHSLLRLDFFARAKTRDCASGGLVCPRRCVAVTGFILGAFLVMHLAVNALGLWPQRFQAVVNSVHELGLTLPVLELGLVLVPLTVHVALGLRTLCLEKLRFGVEKHHHGSDLRYWLQRVTAMLLLVFLTFHFATMHPWGLRLVHQLTHWPWLGHYAAGGLFEPHRAHASISAALWHFWDQHEANPANLLIAQLYLLGVAAAVFHLANGFSTGAEVLGFVNNPGPQQRLWRVCIVAGFGLGALTMTAWYAFSPCMHH